MTQNDDILEKKEQKSDETISLKENIDLNEDKKPEDILSEEAQDHAPKDEDDDQQFIDKQNPRHQAFEDIKEELQQTSSNLEGILPEGHQQRNLDREVGGLEQDEKKEIIVEDAWDNRSEEVDKMGEDAFEELTDAATSTVRQSFIHTQKQKKKRAKKNHEEAVDSFESMSHVEKLKNMREDKSTSTSVGDRGRW